MFAARYEEGITYTDIMRDGIRRKYGILRYLYSEMMALSANGGQFFKPLFYNYPTDEMAYKDVNNNFLIGNSLKASMLTNKVGQNTTDFYFPEDLWCNIYTDKCVGSLGGEQGTVTLDTKAYDVNVHMPRGGLIPFQDPFTDKIMSITELNQKVPVSFKANPVLMGNMKWTVNNSMAPYYNDDGVVFNTTGMNNTYLISIGNSNNQNPNRYDVIFNSTARATSMEKADEPGCYEINRGDYLGDITIYNGLQAGMGSTPLVSVYAF
jgi:alpha-glucosidase (family GH31 glycosyl hydrolase)